MRSIRESRRRRRPAAAGLVAIALTVALIASAESPAAGKWQPRQRAHLRATTVSVGIRSFAFHPHTLTVGRGTRVVFANRSSVTHTATRGGGFDTGRIRPGHSVAVRFASPGVFTYHCKIHSFMHGKIVVR